MTTTCRFRYWRHWVLRLLVLPMLMVSVAHAQSTPTPQTSQKIYDSQQLDQLLAPVALYPDALLSQILMAATYPSDVAEAVAWSAAHPKAQGDDAVKQVANQPWDPSVQSLVAFPSLMAQLKDQNTWVRNLGDAFLAQPEDVMASVQRLRAKAKSAGNLKSTEQQKVVEQQAPAGSTGGSTTYIEIQPTNPDVVYVPSYNPTVVYGAWPYPAYPPTYWPPPYGYAYPVGTALAAGLAFGVGVAAINSLWGNCNWGGGNVDVNVNRYNNINTNNRISGNGNTRWNHDPANRRGTPYRDAGSREKFGQGVGGADQRQQFRGRDTASNASRQRSLESFDRSTNNGSSNTARRSAGQTGEALNRPGGGGASGNREGLAGREGAGGGNRSPGAGGGMDRNSVGDRSSTRQAPSARDNAFSGGQSPGNARRQSERGQASQRSMNSNRGRSGGGGGHQMSRPSPSRGGGGGRRRVGV